MDAVLIGFIIGALLIVSGVFLFGVWLGSKEGRRQARGDWLITGTVPERSDGEPTVDDLRYAVTVASEGLRRRNYVGAVAEQTEVAPGTWWKHRFNGVERLVKVTAVARAYSGHRVTFRVWNHDLFSIDADIAPETEVLSTFVRRAEKTISPHEARRRHDERTNEKEAES